MVHILENWLDFVEYAKNCRYGAYQVKRMSQTVEVRVMAGKFGYVAVYDLDEQGNIIPEQKESYNEVIRYCKDRQYFKVSESIPEEQFFV